jgi:mono/diheme cytochrome c family protein
MKQLKTLIANFAAAILALTLAAVVLLIWRGVQVQAPGKWESRVIAAAKHTLLVGGKDANNPLPKNPDTMTEGRRNFSHYCYACHGLDGQNTGVPFSEAMSPPVPSLVSTEVQSYTDGQLYWVIRNGLWPSGMPASRGILTDEEMWTIVEYIRNLPPAGSLGEPPAYSGEDCAAATQQPVSSETTR